MIGAGVQRSEAQDQRTWRMATQCLDFRQGNALDHLKTGDVEAVAFVSVHEPEQCLLLLHCVRRLELVQRAQVKEDALLKECHRLFHHSRLQRRQRVRQAAHVQRTDGHVVNGLQQNDRL